MQLETCKKYSTTQNNASRVNNPSLISTKPFLEEIYTYKDDLEPHLAYFCFLLFYFIFSSSFLLLLVVFLKMWDNTIDTHNKRQHTAMPQQQSIQSKAIEYLLLFSLLPTRLLQSHPKSAKPIQSATIENKQSTETIECMFD